MSTKELFPLILAGLLVAGCTKPYRTPEILPQDAIFHGIETAPGSTGNPAATLVMIHGMCHNTPDWVTRAVNLLVENFGYTARDDELRTVLDGGPDGVSAYRADLVRGNRRLALYGILYAPVAYPIKQAALCRDVTADTVLCPFGEKGDPKRAKLNAELKHVLMNECLADAMVYFGPAGKTIRLGVRDALHAIDTDRRQDTKIAGSPLFLLSESLGSKVLRDALLCQPDARVDQIVIGMLADTTQVFLGSNQIPLLNLGGMPKDCDRQVRLGSLARMAPEGLQTTGDFSDVLGLIDAAREEREKKKPAPERLQIRAVPEPTRVVNFTDPNDLLSYEVDPGDYGDREIINVRVSNDYTWFGYLESPLPAHHGYRDNRGVLELIRCGHGVPGSEPCRSNPVGR